MSTCSPQFVPHLPVECLTGILADVRSGKITMDTVQKINWSLGCVVALGVGPSIFSAANDEHRQLLAGEGSALAHADAIECVLTDIKNSVPNPEPGQQMAAAAGLQTALPAGFQIPHGLKTQLTQLLMSLAKNVLSGFLVGLI